MVESNKKYNTGKPNEKLPESKEERASVIRIWAEGNEHLENAITNCVNNNIETWACCAGHHYSDFPYLSMKIDEKNKGKILSIMNDLVGMSGITIDLSFMQKGGQGEVLTITSNMRNRNRCFDIISQASSKSLKLDETNEITQALWNLHSGLTSYQIEHGVEVTHSRLKGETLTIRPVYKNFSDILDEFMKRHNIMQVYYRKSFLNVNKLKELTGNIVDKVKEKFGNYEREDFSETLKYSVGSVDIEAETHHTNRPEIEENDDHII